MPHFNMAQHAPGAANPVAPSRHPLRYLLLMAGLGVGAPLLGYGLLAALARLGGWTWAFPGHPTDVSWESLALEALLVLPPFLSLLVWWYLLVTRAPQSTFRRGLLAGLVGAVTAFPLVGFLLGGVLEVVANPGQTISLIAALDASVLGAFVGLAVLIIPGSGWLWIGWVGLLGGLLGLLAGRQDRRPPPASARCRFLWQLWSLTPDAAEGGRGKRREGRGRGIAQWRMACRECF
jgi:hypothetical protein